MSGKTVSEMTCNVSTATLNPLSIYLSTVYLSAWFRDKCLKTITLLLLIVRPVNKQTDPDDYITSDGFRGAEPLRPPPRRWAIDRRRNGTPDK